MLRPRVEQGSRHETVSRIGGVGSRALALTGNASRTRTILPPGDFGSRGERLGPLTLAANCAGVADAAPAKKWRSLNGSRCSISTSRAFFSPARPKAGDALRKQGSIVNIASMSGTIVNRGILQVHYNASKAAVIQLTESLAMEWCGSGIRVNAISPGYTATPMNLRPRGRRTGQTV